MTTRYIGLLAVLALAACDNGPSAVQTRDRASDAAMDTAQAVAGGPAEAATAGATPTAITANRRETVDAKAQRLFARNGAAFGARSPQDLLDKIEAFTTRPPAGTETVKRPNGDTLYYHAASNTFAVVSRDGTPRTMFKPDDGPTYWAEQKERAPTFGRRTRTGGGGSADPG